jgi:hypothetical protein
MTRFVGTPLRGIEFSGPSDEVFSARVNEDTQPRIRIDAGGRITWSSGTVAGDTVLFREGDNSLATYDLFTASAGLVTVTTQGAPTAALPSGAIAVDIQNDQFYFRSNGQWKTVESGGNATVIIQSEPPIGQPEGTLWLNTDTLILSIYYDGIWEPVSGESELADLTDVSLSDLQDGQILKYSSASAVWYNEYEAIQNVDGGTADSVYGGILVLSGGGAAG